MKQRSVIGPDPSNSHLTVTKAMMLPKEDHRTVGVPQVGGSRIEEVGMSSFNAELPSLSVCL